MSQARRNRSREHLERELETEEYTELLRALQESKPFFRQFDGWLEVVAFMREGTSEEAANDQVLLPIFRSHAERPDARWRSVLLAIFWPGLESTFWQKSHWDRDPDERWQNVMWAFLQTICRLDVEKRRCRLVQKVVNDTVSRLHLEYSRRWKRAERETPTEHEEIDALAGGIEDAGLLAFELRDELRARVRRLRGHVKAGRISKTEFLLLVSTRIYGKSVAEYARERGLDYEVARKRRQRAEARIRRHEEKQKKPRI
jgi:hypothetical protein